MVYKDKDKQREADRARQQRRRDVIKSKGVTNTGRDGQGVTELKAQVNSVYQEFRKAKPGDADYNGVCTKEWRVERGR